MRATWTPRLVGTALTALLVAAIAVGTSAQTPDPLIGTWKLDVAKSTYKPGPAPKSVTVVVEPASGKGVKISVDGAAGDGTPIKVGYTTMRDGKDVPVTGSTAYDTAAVTQTSPHEGTIVYKKAGKTAVTAKTSIAKDGKTMTVTYDGTDPKGQAMHNVAHYVKQ
jgi:hypothetical protein